jgi:uncharacterized membrane protein
MLYKIIRAPFLAHTHNVLSLIFAGTLLFTALSITFLKWFIFIPRLHRISLIVERHI